MFFVLFWRCYSSRITVNDFCDIHFTQLTVPVRGARCLHLQCFDAASYVAFQRSDVRFRCPVCSQTASPEELVVDAYFEDLLHRLPHNVDEIVILPDGSVDELSTPSTTSGANGAATTTTTLATTSVTDAKRKRDDDDDNDDNDDDDDDNNNNNANSDLFKRLKMQMLPAPTVIELD